jgi:hypothetical protein
MTDISKSTTPKKVEREKALAQDRRDILSMTPEKALDAVAEHPYPVTLVQSFSEEDLYLLVHTIGPDDALPILGLASNEQWEYFLDTDTWTRDRIDVEAVTHWLDRLLRADADRFTHWISQNKTDELVYYLFRNIEVVQREHDQDPSDFGEDFFTEDQTHYARLKKVEADLGTGKQYEEERDHLVTDLLKRIAVYDYPKYIAALLGSSSILPAEAEEDLYRLRNVRMAEKGFIPHEEAVGVYQPLDVPTFQTRARKSAAAGGRRVEAYPHPIVNRRTSEGANRFARALAKVQDEGVYQNLQSEFAGLCNQVVSADQIVVRQKKTLNQVVAKVSDYISLGLENVSEKTASDSTHTDVALIQTHMLSDLFRLGYGCALELKWKAERWQRSAWVFDKGLPLSFWGEDGMGVLGGLLLKKPLRYNAKGAGSLYGEFATMDQIRHTRRSLDIIMAYDNLLAKMDLAIGPGRPQGVLTYQNLLLTLWARHHMALSDADLQPIPLDQFRKVFAALWEENSQTPKIKNSIKEDFLAWLAQRSGLTAADITENMADALERLFTTIEDELGPVEAHHLDPRFVHLFILEIDKKS